MCNRRIIRYTLMVLCIATFVFGIILIGVGIYAITNRYFINHLTKSQVFYHTVVSLILAGALVSVFAVLGFLAAKFENTFMLITFFLAYTLILIMIFGGLIAWIVFHIYTLSGLNGRMKGAVQNSGKDKQMDNDWDDIHKTFKCCGADGPGDYTSNNMSVPLSCCVCKGELTAGVRYCREPFSGGCYTPIKDYLMYTTSVILIILFLLICAMICQLVLTCLLLKHEFDEDEEEEKGKKGCCNCCKKDKKEKKKLLVVLVDQDSNSCDLDCANRRGIKYKTAYAIEDKEVAYRTAYAIEDKEVNESESSEESYSQ